MRINKCLGRAILSLALLLPFAASAQESSVNTYSPYTLYGLGNLNYTGSSSFSAMGGTSIAFRSGLGDSGGDIRVNTTNPAALSALPMRSIIFDVGLTGSNVYLKQNALDENNKAVTRKSSFNTFNFSNITLAIPIARKLGMAVNVAPYSQIGYNIQLYDDSELANLGWVKYNYIGEGDITEAKLGMGWEPVKGLSIGAEMIYLWGNIERTYTATVNGYTGSGTYNNLSAYTREKVSRIYGGFGVQYTPLAKNKNRLTIGATYRMGGKLNASKTDFIPSNNIYGDTVRFHQETTLEYMPQMIGAGVYFHRPKYAIGVDYVYQDWAKNNAPDRVNNVEYVNTHTIKFGAQYTPSRYDIRSFMKRVTYRVGFRYNDYYLQYHGKKMTEKAVTFGFEIPFKMATVSNMNIGFEFGERGSLQQELIRERYFKINLGVFLFGRDFDYWFEKYKYN